MSHQRAKPIATILVVNTITLGSALITSCSFSGKADTGDNATLHLTENAAADSKVIYNKIDDSAITFKAKYGITYEIIGNVIGKYQHFDLALFSKKNIPGSDTQIVTYELTSKDGLRKAHFTCDPRKTGKQHFYLEDLHFYYHSNSKDQVTIYMPPQLLAAR